MRVRINEIVANPLSWYAAQVGAVYEVREHFDPDYFECVDPVGGLIKKIDCEVLGDVDATKDVYGNDPLANMDAFSKSFAAAKAAAAHLVSNDKRVKEPQVMTAENNGGTTSYYDTPPGNTTINDLIEHKQMQFWQGEIMKAIYGLDGRIEKNGGSEARELNKIVYYVNRRLGMLGLPKYSIDE